MVEVREKMVLCHQVLCKGREIRLKLFNLNPRYNLRRGTLMCSFEIAKDMCGIFQCLSRALKLSQQEKRGCILRESHFNG
jgi:hypothetical protein